MDQTAACERERDWQRENGAYLNEAMQRSLVGDGVGSIPASAAAQNTAPVRQKRRHFLVCRRARSWTLNRRHCGFLRRHHFRGRTEY
jgi:hypothetical protein